MKHTGRLGAAAAAAVLAALLGGEATPLLHAQSLADVARKEEERRKTIKAPAKVYTNKDLSDTPAEPPSAAAPAPAATPETKPADTKDADKAKDQSQEPEKDQKYWSERMTTLRAQLDRDQTFADALQSRINALTTDFVNRDDPAQRAVIERDRQKALAELDRLQKQIEGDKKAISDAEEEARKAGVPPGWLRS